MPDTFTGNYNFTLPEVGGSLDTWGTKLNANFGLLDTILRDLYLDNVGELILSTSATVPRRTLKCDGQTVSRTTYSDLWDFADASGNIAASEGAKTAGQFGPGDGSTTFSLPDYRGYFLRAHDDGAGIDTGRALELVQTDQNASHTHTGTTDSGGSHDHGGGGNTSNAGSHNHTASSGSDGSHSHSGSTDNDSHTHGGGSSMTGSIDTSGSSTFRMVTGATTTGANTGSLSGFATDSDTHSHSLNINSAGSHSHSVTVNSASSHNHTYDIPTQASHTHGFTTASSGGAEVRVQNLAVRVYIRH